MAHRSKATQRRFEKSGFHPHQLQHWHRMNSHNGRPEVGGTESRPSGDPVGALEEVLGNYNDAERDVIRGYLQRLLEAS